MRFISDSLRALDPARGAILPCAKGARLRERTVNAIAAEAVALYKIPEAEAREERLECLATFARPAVVEQ